MSKYNYPIVCLKGKNILQLWDGPHLSYSQALRLLKKRRRQYPGKKLFIYRERTRPYVPFARGGLTR